MARFVKTPVQMLISTSLSLAGHLRYIPYCTQLLANESYSSIGQNPEAPGYLSLVLLSVEFIPNSQFEIVHRDRWTNKKMDLCSRHRHSISLLARQGWSLSR